MPRKVRLLVVSDLQIAVMQVLPRRDEDPISMGEIFARLGYVSISPSMRVSLSKCVARLMDRGLVERIAWPNWSRRTGYLIRKRMQESSPP